MVEFIGFIISLLALLYLFISQNRPPQRQAHLSDSSNREEEESFKKLMKMMERETSGTKRVQDVPPPPPKAAKRTVQKAASLEDRDLKSKYHHHEEPPTHALALPKSYHFKEEDNIKGPSRAQLAIQRLSSKREMVIYQEVMDKPKSMRPWA